MPADGDVRVQAPGRILFIYRMPWISVAAAPVYGARFPTHAPRAGRGPTRGLPARARACIARGATNHSGLDFQADKSMFIGLGYEPSISRAFLDARIRRLSRRACNGDSADSL